VGRLRKFLDDITIGFGFNTRWYHCPLCGERIPAFPPHKIPKCHECGNEDLELERSA